MCRKIKQIQMARCHATFESSSEDNSTDAEVSGYRLQPQKERHELEEKLETGGYSDKTEDTWEDELRKRQMCRDAVHGLGPRLNIVGTAPALRRRRRDTVLGLVPSTGDISLLQSTFLKITNVLTCVISSTPL